MGKSAPQRGRVKEFEGQHWHGLVVWVKTPTREERFLYSEKVLTESQAIVVLKYKDTGLSLENYRQGLRGGVTHHATYPVLDTCGD